MVHRPRAVFFAWAATLAELGFGVLLVVGLRIRIVARLSGLLLSTFALSMLVFLRPKAPLDYSVFTAAAAAFALGYLEPDRFSVDRRRG